MVKPFIDPEIQRRGPHEMPSDVADQIQLAKTPKPYRDPDGTLVVTLSHDYAGIGLAEPTSSFPKDVEGVIKFVHAAVDEPGQHYRMIPPDSDYTPEQLEKINRDAGLLLAGGGPYHGKRK